MNRLSPRWSGSFERWSKSAADVTAPIRSSACNRSAGWNRWWSATSACWMRGCDPAQVYAQVPAFPPATGMLDLLGMTADGRLAVMELKADEDVYLPMQGLDYWARVRHHLHRGELQKHGYFPGLELSTQDPILILAAPALHVHTSAAAMLRYVSPEVDWRLVGLDEHWRDGIRVVFHKESEKN